MGCCSSKNKGWDRNFKPTAFSANRCDAIWETIRGEEAAFGMSPPFQPCARFGITPGVIRVQIGYAGGTLSTPSLDFLGDHTLAVNVEFDPKKVKYEQLLDIFWNYHDIFLISETAEHQSTIFYRNDEQKHLATMAKHKEQLKHEHNIVTIISPFTSFYPSDDEHQHFVLQSNAEVMKCLGKNLPPNLMAYSHLACRLEGYIAGYGTPDDFDKELPELYIPELLAYIVRMACEQNQILEPGTGHMNDWG